jgi:hypothetical protein
VRYVLQPRKLIHRIDYDKFILTYKLAGLVCVFSDKSMSVEQIMFALNENALEPLISATSNTIFSISVESILDTFSSVRDSLIFLTKISKADTSLLSPNMLDVYERLIKTTNLKYNQISISDRICFILIVATFLRIKMTVFDCTNAQKKIEGKILDRIQKDYCSLGNILLLINPPKCSFLKASDPCLMVSRTDVAVTNYHKYLLENSKEATGRFEIYPLKVISEIADLRFIFLSNENHESDSITLSAERDIKVRYGLLHKFKSQLMIQFLISFNCKGKSFVFSFAEDYLSNDSGIDFHDFNIKKSCIMPGEYSISAKVIFQNKKDTNKSKMRIESFKKVIIN